jgi:hypothetical protein
METPIISDDDLANIPTASNAGVAPDQTQPEADVRGPNISDSDVVNTPSVPPVDVAKVVTDSVRASNGPISGSSLSAHIRLRFPTFRATDYRCRNLREFISRYAPDVEPAGFAGLDPLYALKDPALARSSRVANPESEGAEELPRAQSRIEPPAVTHQQFEAQVFRSFANPSGKFVVYGNRTSGELRVQPSSEPDLGLDWVRIPSTSRAFHVENGQILC